MNCCLQMESVRWNLMMASSILMYFNTACFLIKNQSVILTCTSRAYNKVSLLRSSISTPLRCILLKREKSTCWIVTLVCRSWERRLVTCRATQFLPAGVWINIHTAIKRNNRDKKNHDNIFLNFFRPGYLVVKIENHSLRANTIPQSDMWSGLKSKCLTIKKDK